jgi:hypothetical protein
MEWLIGSGGTSLHYRAKSGTRIELVGRACRDPVEGPAWRKSQALLAQKLSYSATI